MYVLIRVGFRRFPLLHKIGPAKSIPTVENGGEGVILAGGSCPMTKKIFIVLGRKV